MNRFHVLILLQNALAGLGFRCSKPIGRLQNVDVSARPGDNISLECNVRVPCISGYYQHWYKQNYGSETLKLVQTNRWPNIQRLQLTDLTLLENGVYHCVIGNNLGQASSRTNLQVRQMGTGELRSRNVFDSVQNFVRSLYVYATGNYNRKK